MNATVSEIINTIEMGKGRSVYAEVSKKVGFDERPIMLPRKEFSMALLKAVKAGNLNAFEAVLRYYRFGMSPQGDNEKESLLLIVKAFSAGKELFTNVPA